MEQLQGHQILFSKEGNTWNYDNSEDMLTTKQFAGNEPFCRQRKGLLIAPHIHFSILNGAFYFFTLQQEIGSR